MELKNVGRNYLLPKRVKIKPLLEDN